jgi:hypothetical protein
VALLRDALVGARDRDQLLDAPGARRSRRPAASKCRRRRRPG